MPSSTVVRATLEEDEYEIEEGEIVEVYRGPPPPKASVENVKPVYDDDDVQILKEIERHKKGKKGSFRRYFVKSKEKENKNVNPSTSAENGDGGQSSNGEQSEIVGPSLEPVEEGVFIKTEFVDVANAEDNGNQEEFSRLNDPLYNSDSDGNAIVKCEFDAKMEEPYSPVSDTDLSIISLGEMQQEMDGENVEEQNAPLEVISFEILDLSDGEIDPEKEDSLLANSGEEDNSKISEKEEERLLENDQDSVVRSEEIAIKEEPVEAALVVENNDGFLNETNQSEASIPGSEEELRHGRVQSVKLLSDETSASSGGNGGVRSGLVSFIDIRSAAKAYRAVHSIANQPLDINYHEPGAAPPRCHPPMDAHPAAETPSDIPVVIGQGSTNNVGSNQSPGMHNNSIPGPSMYRQQRFPLQHGQSEDSSSHFYDQPKSFGRGRGDGHGYRGRRDRHNNYNRHSFHNNNMDRSYRMQWGYSNESSRVAPPAHSQADERTTGPAQGTHPPVTSEVTKPPRRPDSPASTVSSRHVPSKRHKSRSVSESGSSDRGSTAGSRSRSGSRSSVSTSSGRSRSPPHHGSTNHFPRGASGAVRFQNNSYSRQRYRRSRVTNRPTDSRARHSSRSPVAASASSSTSSSPSPHRKAATVPPHSPSHSPSSSKSYSPSRGASTTSHHYHQHHRRPPNTAELHAAIKIRNLPARSSDTSLKDGLYHLFKKHGKVGWVKVIGNGMERYAIVCFKSQEYAAKAVQSSQESQFFGSKILVTPYYEESVGGTDEESRGPVEEESSFPTRTVLITSLESSVTVSELKSVFDQYGDIVNIDIRKQTNSTHAVCEFLDIASSIRAKWGRHVFKSREARISFSRTPPTTTLLLDGTAGVTEKQVMSHCSQYGAIKSVDMDMDRCLTLVQYEEISSAETAIRELGNWAIKGKKLDIDFASQDVIRRFHERLDPGLGNSSQSVGSSSPSSNNPNAGAGKDGSTRKARSRLGEYMEDDDSVKSGYRTYRNDLDGDSKPMTTQSMEESSPPSHVIAGRILAVSRESHEGLNNALEHSYRRLDPALDQRSTMACTKSNGNERTDMFSTSGSVKIDLNCHETDSAIVTSSSDIIAIENSDTDGHSNFTGSSASGDEKVGSLFEPAIKHRKGSSENVTSVLTTTTIDGVSSTSPEPKTEIVSTSADPGLGIGTDSVARYLNDAVATDSQKRLIESKIRRTSADSGNHLNSSPECHALHSNQEVEKIPSSKRSETVKAASGTSRRTEEGDDRPGTPLCDENPDGFDGAAGAQKSASIPPPNRSSNNSEPASLPETPKHQKSQSSSHSKDSKSKSSGTSSHSNKKLVVSPTISPSSGASSSVMLSSTNDTSIFSPNNESSEAPAYSKSSTNSFESSTSNFNVAGELTVKSTDTDELSGAVSSDKSSVQVVKSEVANRDQLEGETGFSSDSEGGLSPRHSPTAELEQRIKILCERYDTWDGNRKILKHTPPVSHSPLHASNQDTNSNSGSNSKDSLIDQIKQTIPQFSGTSDIGRTVLARKSIFDEDCERLENFNEKYEKPPPTLIGTSTNWKLPTLSRSTSCTATPFLSQTSPLTSGNCVPPLSSPISSISPIGNFGSTTPLSTVATTPTTPKPTIVPLSSTSPGYSSSSPSLSLSSAIIGKCVSEKKDLSAPLPQPLNRSLSTSSTLTSSSILSQGIGQPPIKSFGSVPTPIIIPTHSKLGSGIVVPPSIPSPLSSVSTKSFGSSQSSSLSSPFTPTKTSLPLSSPLTPSTPLALKPEQSPVLKKAPVIQPIIIPTTSSHAFTAGSTSSSGSTSSIITVQNNVSRSVERSLSVESRKSSPGVSTPSLGLSGSGSTSSYSDAFGPVENITRPLTPRRISVDTSSSSGSSSVSTDSSESGKQSVQLSSENKPVEVSEKSEVSREKYGSSESKGSGQQEVAHSQQHQHFKEKGQKEVVQSKDSGSAKPISNSGQSEKKKSELSSLKDEISSKVQPVHQETTVAVVASVQTPLLTSRNELINTSKESSKKDKDKKRRTSGTSTPVSSGGGGGSGNHGHQSGSSGLKSESHSNQGSSTSSSKIKEKEERKERKESKSSSSNSVESKNDDSHHGGHHRKEKREKEKEHRENSGDRSSFPMSKESHSHKRDKDNKDKSKRRLSSQENDQDRKKIKLEKEGSQQEASSHHHHRSKGSESKDSREGTKEPSLSTKDKMSSKDRSEKESSKPEKSSSTSSTGKDQSSTTSSQNAEPRKEKDGKERDHHHKKSSSSSSSSSKHHGHHQVQKSRNSLDSHSSSSSAHKADSSVSKDPHKKEKEKEKSSGKENNSSSSSKSASKHHSHTSHSSSSSKPKESTSSSSSSKNKSSSSIKKEKEKPKQERTLSSLDSDDDSDAKSSTKMEVSSERIKSERSEKREEKRDRHKSGGGDSGQGDSDKGKSKKKEPKKRRRIVVDDSGSSDTDDEEEKKHHSIFDVVIDYSDYYVSMYDKVKRSNRACKNNQQQKQQEEEQKQKKMADSFNKLKQSRAKREEKKRSTSIEERKSMTNTSSDEGSQAETMNDFEAAEHRRKQQERHQERQEKPIHTSDDDDRTKSSTSSVKANKSKRKMKNKSSRKDDEKSRKKAKRANKSPSRPNMYSSSTLFSHSDDDSPAGSHPPEQKKKKSSSSSMRHQMNSLGSSNNMSFSGSTKSSDDSNSEPENMERKKLSTSSMSSKPKQFVSFSEQIPNHQSKYNAQNIYSDSDSTDVDQKSTPQQHSTSIHKTPTSSLHSSAQRQKSKDKQSKPKNRKQPLFDSTDSSDNDEPQTAPPSSVHREKKSSKEKEPSTKSNKSRDRDKENKNKKKHRGHKSSSMKSRKQYYAGGDASQDGSHAGDKKESGGTRTMEELFGPMTSSSESGEMTKDSDHERPKTPTMVLTTPSSCEDSVVKKSKSRHHHDKSPFSLSSIKAEPRDEQSETHSTPHVSTTREKSGEKKKKKHHKDKRSKRGSTHEGTPLSSTSSFGKQDSLSSKIKNESVDYDALFNSPAASPSELRIVEDYATPSKRSSVSPIVAKMEKEHVPGIEIRAPTPKLGVVSKHPTDHELDECEKEMRGMFSSDDDDDDDKLKITDAITDAIRASADEQDMDSPTKEIDTEWKRKEEEEKKLNSLVEQDKAIESIVLLERKSPSPNDEDVVKEEIPKDNSLISQEETDVAVATILETLGNEEEEREEKPLIIGSVPPAPLHSPPTLRIIEDTPKSTESSERNDEIENAIAAIAPKDDSDKDREESDPWGYDGVASPKELQIDEGDGENAEEEPEPITIKREKDERTSRSPEKMQTSFDEVSANVEKKIHDIKVEPTDPVIVAKISPRTLSIKEASLASKASDVYEFHDSDDDKRQEKAHLSHTRQTPPMISPPAKSPAIPPPISIPVPESKLQSPPLSATMPVLQLQQPPPPIVLEQDKGRGILHSVVVPPHSSPSALPTTPIVIPSPTKSIPAQTPTPVIATLPPPPPIASVPCTPPITVPSLQRSPPATSVITQPPPPPVHISKSTPPPQQMASRSTIDEAIDEVIRKLHSGDPLPFAKSESPPMPAPVIQPASRAGRRSRSRSKDSPDENASGPRVPNRPDPIRQTGQVLGVIGGHQMEPQPKGAKHPTPMEIIDTSKPKDKKESHVETHSGIIAPPMVQTEEGRYVPIIQHPNEPQIRPPQPGMHQMPQIPLPNRQTPVISRMERDSPGRVTVVEKHTTPLLPHQQIPISKHEGLTAVLAQQQQQQMAQQAHQQHLAHQQQQQQLAAHHQQQQQLAAQHHQQQFAAQHQMMQRKPTEPAPYGYPPQGVQLRPPISSAGQQPPPPVSQAGAPPPGSIIRPVSTAYAIPPGHHPKITTVIAPGANTSPTGVIPVSQGGIPSNFMPHNPVPRNVYIQRSGSPGASGAVYVHPTQQQILQLTTNKPQERQSPRPSSRHTPGPMPLPNVPISQAGKPERIHLPEIPMATTVTKINAGEEQERKSAIMPLSNVVLTSSSGQILGAPPPFLIKAVPVVSSPSQIQMTQQQLQQHRTLQDVFRRSAEGSIRIATKEEQEMIQRVEIHGGSMQPPAHSPKPGRAPLPHEPLISAHSGQPRSIAHRPAYETPQDSSCVPLDLVTQSNNDRSEKSNGRDNEQAMALTISNQSHSQQPTTSTLMARKIVPQGDLRIIPGHGRLGSDAPHYIPAQPDHQSFSPHYMPPNLPNHPMAHQPSPPFGMRHEKPGMPGEKGPEQKGPAIITVVDRPISHSVPPHLSSPHGSEPRGADSPNVGSVFPGQRMYPPSGLPQQQHPTSQAISNMYAENFDQRQFAHSPNYIANMYDSRAISVAAAAAAAMEQERERPKGTASPLDPPYRIRSPPPHISSGEPGLQGDSLLQLLQRYPIMWQGLLALKNDSAAVQMHFVSGSMGVARDSLPSNPDGSIPPLRISQRMRLEQNQLEGVARKLQINNEHCMLLALPCGRDHMDVLHQSNQLRQGFITYLQLKQAAGIVNICHPDTQQAAYVIHIFPSCDFANENLAKIAPDLLSGVADIAHLLIVIATV